ncbi:MAG: nitroreductase family protein [Acidobacteria bacterium]|nr:nitroreductase family protein [Acidobacteriota bacterium]MDW7983241.1 nitroreductase family protein [Acidobacteriota bacterium]
MDAPSAGNLQAYTIVVATDTHTRQALARAALNQMFIPEAPVVLVFLSRPGPFGHRVWRRGPELYTSRTPSLRAPMRNGRRRPWDWPLARWKPLTRPFDRKSFESRRW